MIINKVFALVLGAVVAPVICKVDPCRLPKDPGRCRANKQMFYFNYDTKRCEGFLYKGCGGNANKFENLEVCHEACLQHLGDPEEADVSHHLRGSHCLEPPLSDSGRNCYAFFPRFTFNPDTLQCETYIYGGCGGSSNLFYSEEECRTSCFYGEVTLAQIGQTQSQTKSPTTTPAPRGGKGKSKSKTTTTTTTSSPIEDEEAVSDSEITLSPTLLKDESSVNICNLPPVHPHLISCVAFVERWTFDSKQNACVEYLYGGCYGTKNLFASKEECQAKCSSSPVSKTVDVCGLSIDQGPCKKYQILYGFNKQTNRCEKFVYGGCQGNENKFNSLEDCVNTCGGHEPKGDLMCTAAMCDSQEAAFHLAKGCQPKVNKGECCPSSWDCLSWEERLRRWDECFWADERDPRGRYYPIGDSVPEASDVGACRHSCTCSEGTDGEAQITCSSMDCPNLGLAVSDTSCQPLFTDHNSCCPTQVKCRNELANLFTCNQDDVVYFAGQKMIPKSDPCKICLCKEGWKGQLNDKNYCHTLECALGIGSSGEMKRGCQPIYKEGVCCPVDWVCPLSDQPHSPNPYENDPEMEAIQSEKKIECPPNVNIRQGATISVVYPHPEEPLGISEVTENRPFPLRPASDVCLLPRTLGLCEGYKEAWYFDLEKRKCKSFLTGGPDDGGNLFESEERCKTTCSIYATEDSAGCQFSVSDSDVDDDDVDGNDLCTKELRRYRFNKKTNKCEDFVRTKCGSGMVGYSSMDECELHCMTATGQETLQIEGKEQRCKLLPDVGPCKSRLTRFYYDSNIGKCKRFWYGGCQGNHNNFIDERDCLDTCVPDSNLHRAVHPQDLDVQNACQQPLISGPCSSSMPRYYFDNSTRTCRTFFYGGCGGNDNNFVRLSDCADACDVDGSAQQALMSLCDLPALPGNCTGSHKSYFYNKATGKCEMFKYSGCGGNSNKFETKADCLLECHLPRVLKAELAPSNPGSLQVDINEQKLTFLDTIDSCVLKDTDSPDEDPCLQDKNFGLCKANIKRFYFDKNSKECKRLNYGGCAGNGNNFATQQQCQKRCQRHMSGKKMKIAADKGGLPTNPICSLPVEAGLCSSLVPAYFFNTQTKQCEIFVYGGCRGNANRFVSREDCESACPVTKKTSKGTSLVPLPPPGGKCVFGGQTFNRGDVLRFGNNRCRTCICVSPPSLSCKEKICKSDQQAGANCEPVYDEDGCCVESYICKGK